MMKVYCFILKLSILYSVVCVILVCECDLPIHSVRNIGFSKILFSLILFYYLIIFRIKKEIKY